MKSCAVVGVGFQLLVGGWLTATSLAGCGAEAPPEPKTPDAAAEAPAPAAEPAAAPAEAAPPEAKPEEPKADLAPAAKPAAPAKDPNAAREVKYVVTPEGLKIEVAGVRFLASAAAKQIAQGWGAKVTIKAEATDGKEHVLLNPKNGPIAFAAAVFKKGSTEAERIPDSREGDGEIKLSSSPSTFSREFPAKGGRVLGMGETLDMEVALWGLGESAEDRRPVKQFFHVKMKVDKGKPKAVVEPPSSATGG
jgi:pyruvate/2-oxoglutarate dehydrogenase complex dihydrolipoamide acyltransferase (E2) component